MLRVTLPLIFACAFFSTVFPQNVGIGTAAPAQRLEVDGTVRVTDLAGVGTRPVFANPDGDLTTTGPAVADPWFTTGNTGTNPATNFLGTTDNQALVFRTNNVEEARLTAAGQLLVNYNAVTGNNEELGAETEDDIAIGAYNTTLNSIGISLFATSGSNSPALAVQNNWATAIDARTINVSFGYAGDFLNTSTINPDAVVRIRNTAATAGTELLELTQAADEDGIVLTQNGDARSLVIDQNGDGRVLEIQSDAANTTGSILVAENGTGRAAGF